MFTGVHHATEGTECAASMCEGTECAASMSGPPAPPLIPLCVLWPMILSLASAMVFMHSMDIVHMDLKSENVMLDDDGQPVIIDFGGALTVGNVVEFPMGTPGHIAPEVMAALTTPAVVDPAMDVYSFAVLISEAMTGLPAEEVIHHKHIFPVIMGCDQELLELLSDSLSDEPQDRPKMTDWVQSAAEACARLKCGGRTATRPLLDAAAALLAAYEGPEAAPASTVDIPVGEPVLATPLPVQLPAVSAPRAAFAALVDADPSSEATPVAGGGSPTASLLQSTPSRAAGPPSPLPYAESPMASPVALTPHAAVVSGAHPSTFEFEAETWAGMWTQTPVKAEDTAESGRNGVKGEAEHDGNAREKGSVECGCQCSLECGVDVGVQTEGGGPGGVRWGRWALAAGVVGLVAAKLLFRRH